jgi:hypothetical protein
MCRIECPVECIEVHPDFIETEEVLFERAKSLFPDHKFAAVPPSHLKK